MFDFHLHSAVSFDGHGTAPEMARAAKAAGLREICFTDHIDEDPKGIATGAQCFDLAAYGAAYDHLEIPGLTIRKGLEFGMLPGNQATLRRYLAARKFDFVLGSVHYAAGEDVYFPPYWAGRSLFEGERQYLEDTLACVGEHDFDVLAHLTYISKAQSNPAHSPVEYAQHREMVDEILKILVARGKGLELNTSGVDVTRDFLPPVIFLRRFRELGGQIVTLGSDAHGPDRVGQYTHRALGLLKDIFGYVCTFADRQPVFHRL